MRCILIVRAPEAPCSEGLADALIGRRRREAIIVPTELSLQCELIGVFLVGVVAGFALAAAADYIGRALRGGVSRDRGRSQRTSSRYIPNSNESVDRLLRLREASLRATL